MQPQVTYYSYTGSYSKGIQVAYALAGYQLHVATSLIYKYQVQFQSK